MKRVITCMLMMVLAMTVSAVADRKDPAYRRAVTDGAQAQICVKVVDDDGNPVPLVSVTAVIAMHFSEYRRGGRTDTNGCFVVEGKTTGNYIELWTEKDGYYQSKKKLVFIGPECAHEVKDGRWQPYGAVEKIILRRKIRPIRLEKVEVIKDVPVTNQWVAFDLSNGDFLPPWGKGTFRDIEMNVEWDGMPTWKSRFCKSQIRFPIVGSGGYFEKVISESVFPFPVVAVTNKVLLGRFDLPNRENGCLDPQRNFRLRQCSLTYRTRCRYDETGRLIEAHWGNIHSLMISPGRSGHPTLLIEGVFNPCLNDLGLEPSD